MLRSRFMDTVGDGTGSINMAVDGSTTEQIFRIKPQQGEILKLTKILLFMEDSGTLDSGGFGNGTALTNGCVFASMRYVGTPEEIKLPTFQEQQLPIKKNQEFKALSGNETFSNYGSGSQSLCWNYILTEDTGGLTLELNAALKEELWFIIRDDVSVKCDFLYARIGCRDYP